MTKQTGLAMLLLLAATTISLQASDTERWSREIIVKWREVPARLDGDRFPAEVRGQVVDVRAALPVGERTTVGLERISVVEVNNASTVPKFIALLQHDPQVEYVEPRALRYIDGWTEGGNRGREGALDGVPNDPFYGQQWGLVAMEAEAAWNITRGDPSVAIAVLDLGVDFTHPELVHCRWENAAERSGVAGVDDDGNGFVDDVYGWDFVEGDGEPWSQLLDGDEAHGTHVAGLAAAARNNGQGIAGLAPDCKIMGVRVGHHGQIPYGYDGIYYACRSGAKVINCSWGGEFESAYERDVVQYAAEMGCVIVASAGNSATSQEHYPAGIEGVLSVAATRIGDFAADFTQYGSWVKVSAPGVAMLSTFNTPGGGHSYGTWQGTSMSAPLVAATCALVKSRFPQMTGRHLMARVMGTADPIDGKNPTLAGQIGLGRVNAWRALADSAAGIRVVDDSLTETSGNGDGRIRAGETATLRLAIRNDGTGVGGMAAFLATSATDVGLRNPVLVFEDVPPGGPVWSESVVAIELAGTARRGFLLPLSIDFIGGNGRLAGRVTRTIYLDSTFVCLDNGRLRLGFAEDGSLGYYDREQDHYIGCGFRTAELSNALYHGSFVLAADGLVSDNAYGNAALNRYDWQSLDESVARLVVSERADVEARAEFADRRAEPPLFAQVESAGLGWQGAEQNGFLILEYAVENRSVNPWNEAYAGLFLDLDVGPSSMNRVFYHEEAGIIYVQAIGSSHPLAGVASIGDSWGSLFVVNNRDELHPPSGEDPLTGWTDERKWQILERGIAAIPTEPADISLLVSYGPLVMDSHEIRTFAYALVSGNDADELARQAESARQRYQGRKSPPPPPTPERRAMKAGLYPNPLAAGEPLHLVLPSREEATVRLYNILGQRVAEFQNVMAGPEGALLDPMVGRAASGLLLYRVETATGGVTGKLLILK